MKDKNFFGELTRGIWKENPTFVLMLGLCPTLAVTTTLKNGVGMALAATFVLVGSNVIISLLRNYIPGGVRIPCFIVVIAAFVTIVDLVLEAYLPALHKELGIFIPLIVVNCIILGRAEAYASKNGVGLSMADGIGSGLGFLLALVIISGVREIVGNGSIWGLPLAVWTKEGMDRVFLPAKVMIQPVGAFLLIGLLLGLFQWGRMRAAQKRSRAAHVLQSATAAELAAERRARSEAAGEGESGGGS